MSLYLHCSPPFTQWQLQTLLSLFLALSPPPFILFTRPMIDFTFSFTGKCVVSVCSLCLAHYVSVCLWSFACQCAMCLWLLMVQCWFGNDRYHHHHHHHHQQQQHNHQTVVAISGRLASVCVPVWCSLKWCEWMRNGCAASVTATATTVLLRWERYTIEHCTLYHRLLLLLLIIGLAFAVCA